MNMKILHVLQTIDKERGGGVTERNLKLVEYLEKFGTDNVILSLKNKNIKFKTNLLPKDKFTFLNYFNERYPIPFPNIVKLAGLVRAAMWFI